MLVLFGIVLFAGWKSGLSAFSLWWYAAYLVGFVVIIAFVRAIMAHRMKTNWDISDRKKRIIPLLILACIFAVNSFAVSMFGSIQLVVFHLIWFIWLIGLLLITLKMKISGHMSVLTLACGILLRWYGTQVLPIFLLIPVLGWSRIVLKRHTLSEVIGGFLYSVIILYISHFFLSY